VCGSHLAHRENAQTECGSLRFNCRAWEAHIRQRAVRIQFLGIFGGKKGSRAGALRLIKLQRVLTDCLQCNGSLQARPELVWSSQATKRRFHTVQSATELDDPAQQVSRPNGLFISDNQNDTQ
jgi:hypothetical protein